MNYEAVLGLEIHLQLNTPTKMFCGCKNDPFKSEPNVHVCPVCLGLPGAMPVPNEKAVKLAQKMALALGSKLQRKIIFERKNYFYPDLPKGFQITCPHYPIGKGGKLDMNYWKSGFKPRFREIHLEEDTAKSHHKKKKTLINFNKSGVPLLEIVTEPDFKDIDIAVQFCKEIQLIARYLDISEADMEKGHMRLEANISVRPVGVKNLPKYRVELKNINSFGFMKKALRYELRRQIEALKAGEKLYQETRGFDEKRGVTYVQRSKEEPNDYRYFPEPDITPLLFGKELSDDIATSIEIMPADIRSLLLSQGLSKQYVDFLVKSRNVYRKYKEVLSFGYSPSKAANLVVNISEYKNLTPEEIHRVENKKKSEKLNSEQSLNPLINEVIKENKKAVQDYKNGNSNSLKFLIGQVMKKTDGKADPTIAKKLLVSLLSV